MSRISFIAGPQLRHYFSSLAKGGTDALPAQRRPLPGDELKRVREAMEVEFGVKVTTDSLGANEGALPVSRFLFSGRDFGVRRFFGRKTLPLNSRILSLGENPESLTVSDLKLIKNIILLGYRQCVSVYSVIKALESYLEVPTRPLYSRVIDVLREVQSTIWSDIEAEVEKVRPRALDIMIEIESCLVRQEWDLIQYHVYRLIHLSRITEDDHAEYLKNHANPFIRNCYYQCWSPAHHKILARWEEEKVFLERDIWYGGHEVERNSVLNILNFFIRGDVSEALLILHTLERHDAFREKVGVVIEPLEDLMDPANGPDVFTRFKEELSAKNKWPAIYSFDLVLRANSGSEEDIKTLVVLSQDNPNAFSQLETFASVGGPVALFLRGITADDLRCSAIESSAGIGLIYLAARASHAEADNILVDFSEFYLEAFMYLFRLKGDGLKDIFPRLHFQIEEINVRSLSQDEIAELIDYLRHLNFDSKKLNALSQKFIGFPRT